MVKIDTVFCSGVSVLSCVLAVQNDANYDQMECGNLRSFKFAKSRKLSNFLAINKYDLA